MSIGRISEGDKPTEAAKRGRQGRIETDTVFMNGLRVIDDAITDHGPAGCVTPVYGCMSGGHDSMAATLVAAEHPNFSGVIHLNTGIGIVETRDYVRKTCDARGWTLYEVRAKEDCGENYDALVLERGFPGPGHHQKMWQRLKERGIEFFFRHHVPRPSRAILVSGRRRDESVHRMIGMPSGKTSDRKYRRVFAAAIHDLTACDVSTFLQDLGVGRNAVVDLLHKSGECLCGAYAAPGELAELGLWYPSVARRILALQERVLEKGFPWGWEGRPPHGGFDTSQQVLPFCSSCHFRQVLRHRSGDSFT